jgi:hypothetical protein
MASDVSVRVALGGCSNERAQMTAGLFFRLLFPFRSGGLAVTVSEVGFAIGLIVGASSDAYKRPFYEAAAQIIPVLLLVLAIEARYFRINLLSLGTLRETFEAEIKQVLKADPSAWKILRWSDAFQGGPLFRYIQQRLLMALVLGILVAGEVIAVLILGQPTLESTGLQGLVLGALFAGLGAVVVAALTGPMAVGDQHPEDAEET